MLRCVGQSEVTLRADLKILKEVAKQIAKMSP